MVDNNALGKMQNLASEGQIKLFKGLLSLKEQKIQNPNFAMNKMK